MKYFSIIVTLHLLCGALFAIKGMESDTSVQKFVEEDKQKYYAAVVLEHESCKAEILKPYNVAARLEIMLFAEMMRGLISDLPDCYCKSHKINEHEGSSKSLICKLLVHEPGHTTQSYCELMHDQEQAELETVQQLFRNFKPRH